MGDISYRCRAAFRGGEVEWTLTGDMLQSSAGLRLPFSAIRAIRLYDVPGMRMASGQPVIAGSSRCVIRPKRGRAIVLGSSPGVGQFENRSASYRAFGDALLKRVAAASPTTRLRIGMPPALWVSWCLILLIAVVAAAFAAVVMAVSLRTGITAWPTAFAAMIMMISCGASTLAVARVVRRERPRRLGAGR